MAKKTLIASNVQHFCQADYGESEAPNRVSRAALVLVVEKLIQLTLGLAHVEPESIHQSILPRFEGWTSTQSRAIVFRQLTAVPFQCLTPKQDWHFVAEVTTETHEFVVSDGL
jgi:hypothetical protein